MKAHLMILGLVLLALTPALVGSVMASDDSITFPAGMSYILADGRAQDLGSSNHLKYTVQDGTAIIGADITMQTDDTYTLLLTFQNGETIPGYAVVTSDPLTRTVRYNLNGLWINSSYWYWPPSVTISANLAVNQNTSYYLIGSNDQITHLVVPLSVDIRKDPLVGIEVTPAGGNNFNFDISVVNRSQYDTNVLNSQKWASSFTTPQSNIDKLISYGNGIYKALVLAWIFIDFFIVRGNALVVITAFWLGLIDYHLLSAPDIFKAIQRSARDTGEMFNFIYRIIYYLAVSLKAFADLINPLKWLLPG